MSGLVEQIAVNLETVRRKIAAAAARAGRSADEITLVAVTKYVGPEIVEALVSAGAVVLGESRPQQFSAKAAALRHLPIRWHLIGHLQRNKIRRTVPLVEMIQSVDSLRLLGAIDRVAEETERRVSVLLEVNVSGDAAKGGFDPDALEPVVRGLADYAAVRVCGLMCMAGLEGGQDAAREHFARLRQLRDRLTGQCPEGVALDELSMGMSRDYEVAVEEGATIVRVGSALYEGIAR